MTLLGDHSKAIPASVLPEPDLVRIAQYAEQHDQHAALVGARARRYAKPTS
ncbi:MAG TPA: hypothetical protein VER11_28710 [Polyangiaceae bacterium]|nr:hypothetical protein [Polyangiaceae bacterium]